MGHITDWGLPMTSYGPKPGRRVAEKYPRMGQGYACTVSVNWLIWAHSLLRVYLARMDRIDQ